MRLTLMQFVSLDGVSQGPGSPEEDTSDGFTQGGWLVPHIDDAFIRRAASWLAGADALLLGRRTYESFARDWPAITDPEDPFTATMNRIPKYVATRGSVKSDWAPTTVLSGDVEARVAELRAAPGRELQIHGSARLAQSLLAAGLVDELRLVIAPVVLGHGRRLFRDGGAPAGLRLTQSETTPGGLAILVFEPVGAAQYATYQGATSAGRDASPRPA